MEKEQTSERGSRLVVLMGPKHSGKTSAGSELARLLNLPFFDLDECIAAKTGLGPRELFLAGPGVFREAEEKALADLLQKTAAAPGVLALGGGIIDNPGALALLETERRIITVCLDLGPESAWRRIAGPGQDRELPPFLGAETTEASRELHRRIHERRSAAYRALADISVCAENKTAAELAEEIKILLQKKQTVV